MRSYLLEMFFVSLILTIAVEPAAVVLLTKVRVRLESKERKHCQAGTARRIHAFLPAVCEKRGFLLVFLVNVLTNPPAVLACWLGRRYLTGTTCIVMEMPAGMPQTLPLQLIVEVVVVAVEAYVYGSFAKDSRWGIRRPMMLSVTANLCSWLCGVGLLALRNA